MSRDAPSRVVDEELRRALFAPRRIAVVGASTDPSKLSGRPVDYLKRFGYADRIAPVNPNHTQVQGLRAYPTVCAIGEPIDLALITVPAVQVAECIRDCATAGVKVAAVFSAGFAETDPPGADQDEIRGIAARAGMRILGPNCLGVMSLPNGLTATFTSALEELDELRSGPIALITQSGAFGTYVFSAGQRAGIGFSHFANTGNEADLSVGELLGCLASERDTRAFLLYLEGAHHGATLAHGIQKARAADKPVVFIKVGSSEAGRRAARWHTASDAGDADVFADVLSQLGAIRVTCMDDLLDAASVFADGRRAAGRRLTILSMSGGGGVLMADVAATSGLQVDEWLPNWQERVRAGLPSYASPRNPIDLTASVIADPGLLEHALQTALDHPDTDLVAVGLGNADRGSARMVDAVVDAYHRTSKPFAVAWTGGSGRPRHALAEAGVPIYADPSRAIRALGMVVQHSLQFDATLDISVATAVPLPRSGQARHLEAGAVEVRVLRDPVFGLLLRLERRDALTGALRTRTVLPPVGPHHAGDLLASLGVSDNAMAMVVSGMSITAARLRSRHGFTPDAIDV